MEANIPWCAKAKYSNLKTFLGGTVVLPDHYKIHEIEEEIRKEFLMFLPPGFEIIELKRGSLFFSEEIQE